ncbi:aminopeptidase [Chitinophaga lutea]|uniref:Aminopeptidase n=1 Tax=Chitinophaga lutea TaxID=2488634 RepID=A0A3N4PJY1_9BACT|nr:C1 family peptidase [Chitinophaga lutea]RPE08993.1 aminopeptidase [Chitinophaga lutea]
MNTSLLLAAAGWLAVSITTGCRQQQAKAEDHPPSQYRFTPVSDIPTTPVADQQRSGTCWCFSTSSFLETEIMRITGEATDLSEMYFVRCAYLDKTANYIMRQGAARFSEGGLNHDPVLSAAVAGMMPQSAYTGLTGTDSVYDHRQLFQTLEERVKAYAERKAGPAAHWKTDIPAILDQYLGPVPAEFTYKGKTYTPQSFAAATQLKLSDYVTITSFTHVPFYQRFILNIPANHMNESFYNLPLEEYIANIDHALANGYSLALDTDASEKGFSIREGIAVVAADTADEKRILTEPAPEKIITQQYRQEEFENFNTTDDHNMHITGKVQDQTGKVYYKVKNSWGTRSGKNGYFYVSIPYMQLKSISVLLHKDGLTAATKSRLNL